MKAFDLPPSEPQPFFKHAKASEIIAKVGKDVFESYFTFAFVRNPWDWQVSLYKYMLRDEGHFQHQRIKGFRDFDEYIRWRCANEVRFQKDFVFSTEGEQLVDFIGKYERLDDDFQAICSRLGISATLAKLNVSNTKPYQDYYNEETIDLVRRAFEPDISLFGYDFESVKTISRTPDPSLPANGSTTQKKPRTGIFMKQPPRISVVTATYNRAEYLEETIVSVLEQNYPDLEYIIIDGGSTDGSVEIIKKYEKHLTYWVSEKDRGQGHALNKGFRKASGDILGWINSDDFYLPGALEEIGRVYRESADTVIAGPVINFNELTGETRLIRPRNITYQNMFEFGLLNRHNVVWHQPGVFLPRKLFEAAGGIDEQWYYLMDHDLYMRLLKHTGVVYAEKPLVKFRVHPDAKTYVYGIDFCLERIRLLEKWAKQDEMRNDFKTLFPELFSEAYRHLAGRYERRGDRRAASAFKHLATRYRQSDNRLTAFKSILAAALNLPELLLTKRLYRSLLAP